MAETKYYTLNVKGDTKRRVEELQRELGGVESKETENGVVSHLIKETYGFDGGGEDG